MTSSFGRRDALIVDVDGTLCDVRQIRHYVDGGPDGSSHRDFYRFHAESIDCPAFADTVGLTQRAKAHGLAVVIVTGRESRWSFLTSLWLGEHRVDYDMLLMRATKDYRADKVIKAQILGEVLLHFRPVLAVDDRPDIAEIWVDAGIPTVLVSENGQLGLPMGQPHAALADLWERLTRG